MSDYPNAYFTLFNQISSTIDFLEGRLQKTKELERDIEIEIAQLKMIQIQCEENYIKNDETNKEKK